MGPIEQLVQERLPPDRAETVQAFARAYLRRLTAAADEDGHDAEALYHELLGAFELAASRDGAPMAVRAFNPTLAEHSGQSKQQVHEDMERDRFFTPQEAVQYGLIDRVLNGNGARGEA